MGNVGGREWAGWSGVKGGKWDNCNRIINKHIFKKITENKIIKIGIFEILKDLKID